MRVAILPIAVLTLIAATSVHSLDETEFPATVIASKFELFVTDVERSILFYETMGFVVAHKKPYGYVTLQNGSVVVALSPVSGWLPLRWFGFLRYPPIGTEIVLYTDRLNELHSALESNGYDPGDIKRQPWGDRDFRVTDYDGYYIRVSEGSPVPLLDQGVEADCAAPFLETRIGL
jgi:catechol 2,3-dioxygenase-like lactoylglutathione lyase family enzyme